MAKERGKTEVNKMMICGFPNVGKSSLINAFKEQSLRYEAKRRKEFSKTWGGASPSASLSPRTHLVDVGPRAGVTRSLQGVWMSARDPALMLIDTPGLMIPKISDFDTAMKLSMIGAMNDEVVGMERIAEYTLGWMNSEGHTHYQHSLGLDPLPSGWSWELLLDHCTTSSTSSSSSSSSSGQKISPLAFSTKFVQSFRSGQFGRFLLENRPPVHPPSPPSHDDGFPDPDPLRSL